MKRIVLLAIVAATQAAWTSQLRSDSEIRQILAERIKGFEQSVGIVVGVIGPEGRKILAYGSMGMNDPRPVNGDTLYEIPLWPFERINELRAYRSARLTIGGLVTEFPPP